MNLSKIPSESRSMLIKAIKLSLENMNSKFTDLSRLQFDKINQTLIKKLKKQKIQERPFAYEFYHQFRKLWDSGCIIGLFSEDIVIQAEVDKGYQDIPNLDKIPDFLLHKPNTDKNFAVIEFKLAFYKNIFNSNIKEDFKKLVAFKQKLDYDYLIEVVIIEQETQLKTAKEHIENNLNNSEGEEIIIIEFDTKSWRANDYKIKYKSEVV
jgi:hypothetical protein